MKNWHTHFSNSLKNPLEMITFELLPSIELFLDKAFDDDQSFSICFKWLFWSFCITKYWGSLYTSNNSLKKGEK